MNEEDSVQLTICQGFGYLNLCNNCKFNIESFDEEKNGWHPDKYKWKDTMICRLPQGLEGKYWSQFQPLQPV